MNVDDNIEQQLIDDQHRELMAFESDVELAYRLQLEEAMAASIAIQPSSTSSQTLEIKDPMIIKTQLNINPPMPEDQWIIIGDNINRPYGEGCSKKNKEDSEEVFRVYFKGLLSDERVKGLNKTVTMAGIGVAICDSKDEVVFELGKNLELGYDERVSRRSVEGQALIEALHAAAALEIKRIVFYCDYHPLYQYVSGKWRPKQQKMITFLDQLNLFRDCFTYCEPTLIASKDVKFAMKLAREAINSQITKAISSQDMIENCVICLDDKSIDQFFSVEGCTHRYCYSCMKQHVEVKLLNGVLPNCPHEGCKIDLRFERCEKFLSPKFIEMMRQRMKEESIPVTEKVYCPYPKCSTLMSRSELKTRGLNYVYGARICYKCHGSFCINCRVPWHENMRCSEYKSRNPTQLVEESKVKNLAARNSWRQCIKCKHIIELVAGCYHMTCRCGYEFCYTCGAEWKNKKATCSCPLWDEENIVDTDEEEIAPEDDDDDGFFQDGVLVHFLHFSLILHVFSCLVLLVHYVYYLNEMILTKHVWIIVSSILLQV
ncbi:E3 ubiquitin-protein ligase RSL1-like [Bidens hawaiensis]|uniref:E3 ubiquitin-protein ligase RSL1-like n=1 Tax=Bidens hawaiensis TaxID=980011 RepID=UPI00404A3843